MPAASTFSSPSASSSLRDPDRFESLVAAVEDYAIFLLDTEGVVRSWNIGAHKIKGYAAEDIIGKPFTIFYPQEQVRKGWPQEELRRAAAQGRFEDEGWRIRQNGERFWANVVITALRTLKGELYGFAKVTRDLTERRRNEELLRQSEERFRLLVENVQDYAIYMIDPEGIIESWNAGAQALKGYAAAEVVGRHFSMFYPAEDQANGRPQRELVDARAHGRVRDEGWRVRKDGSVFWAAVTVTAVYDGEGRLRGYAKVTRDMTDQRRVLELEASARRISQFLAILGHELRNPLAPIRNAVGVMQLDPAFPPRLHGLRGIMDRQLSHLTRLVDDLLDVGRITSGKISLRRERLGWQDMVQRSLEAVEACMRDKRHTVELHLPADTIWVSGDEIRLQQVLQNLLHNAAKYTPEGGHIQVEVEQQQDVLLTRVMDSGVGLHPASLDKIFELFVQGEAEHTRADGGLGIGLAIARLLVELHGGSLRAESPGPGLGSVFTVRLPVMKPEEAGPEMSALASSSDAAQTAVLVVDDNRDSAETMAALVAALGHPVKAVFDGRVAAQEAQAQGPGLVLLDLHMPGRNGFEVLRELRALHLSPPPLVIAMTGYGQEADRARTAEAGFDGHLIKPVASRELLQFLAEASRRRQAAPRH